MLSIVIPALNEERALPATLAAVASLQGDYEVLVVDGGSTDSTLELARAEQSVRVLHAPRGRAAQMNAGAAAAEGEILLFLHADTLLPADALQLIEQCGADFGGFRQKFSGERWQLRFVSWLHNWRCRLSNVFYGDQAMFVSRLLFESVGGFPEVAELEDVMLSDALLEHAKPCLLDAEVITDARKFEKLGAWRGLFYCVLIIICYQLRVPVRGRAFFAPIR